MTDLKKSSCRFSASGAIAKSFAGKGSKVYVSASDFRAIQLLADALASLMASYERAMLKSHIIDPGYKTMVVTWLLKNVK